MGGVAGLSVLNLACLVVFAVPLAGCDLSPAPVAQRDGADACIGHPLVRALPSATRVAGLTRKSVDCSWAGVHALYGGDAGGTTRDCVIAIVDSRAEIPPELAQPEGIELARDALAFDQATHRAAIQLQIAHRDQMLGGGQFLEMIGGAQHLPVVDTLPGGDRYVIPVPTVQDAPTEESLTALLHNERYGLSITCSEKITDQASARARYAPWIEALNFEALP